MGNSVPANSAGVPMEHIVRAQQHSQYFRLMGFSINGWVRVLKGACEGEVGIVHTYPGGDKRAHVIVGLKGASQFGSSGVRVTMSLYDLEPLHLPNFDDIEAVAEWLDA